MGFIIMMHGLTAVSKTDTAKRLAGRLQNTEIHHSATIRRELGLSPERLHYKFDLKDPIFVRKVSKAVYGEMLERAKRSLENGKNVILDATYNFVWQRNQLYGMAQTMKANVYIIHCACSNKEEIMRRLKRRSGHRERPFDEAVSWETYLSTLKFSESPINDRMPDGRRLQIIRYDTWTGKIVMINAEERDETYRRIWHCIEDTKV